MPSGLVLLHILLRYHKKKKKKEDYFTLFPTRTPEKAESPSPFFCSRRGQTRCDLVFGPSCVSRACGPTVLCLCKGRARALLNPTQPVLGGEILIKSQISFFFFFFPPSLEMKSQPPKSPQ